MDPRSMARWERGAERRASRERTEAAMRRVRQAQPRPGVTPNAANVADAWKARRDMDIAQAEARRDHDRRVKEVTAQTEADILFRGADTLRMPLKGERPPPMDKASAQLVHRPPSGNTSTPRTRSSAGARQRSWKRRTRIAQYR